MPAREAVVYGIGRVSAAVAEVAAERHGFVSEESETATGVFGWK